MSWTKQQLVDQAFNEVGKNVEVFNIDPDAMATALRQLDTMMATLSGRGLPLGYPLPSSPGDSSLDDDSGLPDWAIEPVYMNLAIRIAPSIGKNVAPETKVSAKMGMNLILSRAAFPSQQQFPNTLPRGAGNKPYRTPSSPFMPTPTSPLETGSGDVIEFE